MTHLASYDSTEAFLAARPKSGYDRLPPFILRGVWNYARTGWQPGGFLSTFLQGDLGAIAMADAESYLTLRELYWLCYNDLAPSRCWGTPERFRRWIELGGFAGYEQLTDRQREALP